MRTSLCVYLLQLLNCCLVDDELVSIEDVVYIEGRRDRGAYARDVCRRLNYVGANFRSNYQALAGCLDCIEEANEVLGLDLVEFQLINYDQARLLLPLQTERTA